MTPIEETESPPPPPAPPARYRISAPGPVTGGVMGVAFANGQALVEDANQHAVALAWFAGEPGYSVEALDPPEAEPVPASPERPAGANPEQPTEPAEDSPPAATARRRK